MSKAGYYAWRARKPSRRAQVDTQLRTLIRKIHHKKRARYGAIRIHAELKALGYQIARKRVARLMRLEELKAKKHRQFRVTTVSSHSYPIATNVLNRRFQPAGANTAWAADITYFATKEGWLYLAIVMDLFSRRIVGWSMSSKIDAALVISALRMAVQTRSPKPGLLVHTDRGSQYACREYRQFIAQHGILPSMSRKGDCWDNAVAESFFSTLKVELKSDRLWATRSEARLEIFEYIEAWYNRERRHSRLKYLTPVEYEECRPVA